MQKRITAQELSGQIKCLERELFNAKVHYEIFQGLVENWAKHLQAIQWAPVFWQYSIAGHIDNAIIRLCRVYDTHKQSICLPGFLSDVEAHADFFSDKSFRERHKTNPHLESLAKHPRTLDMAQLRRDKEFCDRRKNPLVSNLREWRNNKLAHSNYEEAVRAVSEFHTRYPLPFIDIETLISGGLRIVNRYSQLLDAMTYSDQIASNQGKDYQFVLEAIETLRRTKTLGDEKEDGND